jgi:hypothetical protein
MKLTTMPQVTIDGVMQGNGGASDEDRRNGFERGGWAPGKGDHETVAFINQTYQRADAFLFDRRTYELFAGSWGSLRVPDLALDLVESRVDSKGVAIQVYRPAGRPQYATA